MTMQPFRNDHGGLIDRSQPLEFRFDAKTYQGYAGDTLASALLANGVRLVGRSFKYHRPRGILTAGIEEPNALVELRTGARREANTRATVVELYDGLEASSQNRWPSLKYDLLSVNQLLSPFLVAGFYYKTFKWPPSFWEPVYERLIRRAAGLGNAAETADPDHYEKAHAHCDVLVIGGGVAGLASAIAAGRSGARVIVAEQGPRLGGSLLSENVIFDGASGSDWAVKTTEELQQLPNVTIMTRTSVFGRYDGGTYAALEAVSDHLLVPPDHVPRQRLWRIYAKTAILASGAIERSITFADNDKPGVMFASAARTYINRYGVKTGRSAVVCGNNDDIYRTVTDLSAAGINIAAVVDSRPNAAPYDHSYPHFRGHVVSRAIGGHQVRAAEIRDRDSDVALQQIDCDLICVAGGWNPTIHLATHKGTRPVYDQAGICFVMPDAVDGELHIVGSAHGALSTKDCLASGAKAGAAAAAETGHDASPSAMSLDITEPPLGHGDGLLRTKSTIGKAFVDFQNDVTDKDIELAVREGYSSAEHAKRYTTLGMATDQGKTGSLNGSAIIAQAVGADIADVGITTHRPPFAPVCIGAFGGHSVGKEFQPVRETPIHDWHKERGAVFVESGLWYRAQYYPQSTDETWLDAAIREVKTTRSKVGICDVSTLGKIDIQGRDAGLFLNKLYCNGWTKLAIGKARYGLMLREDGIVMDDGTTSRLAEDHYVMTTTTANAGPVMSHIEFCHAALWPELDVQYVSVTEQWAQMAVAGPDARNVLAKLVDDLDLGNDAFPFMATRNITILDGMPARLFRISFSGELAYELAVPADYGRAAWQGIMAAGAEFGIRPYGLEALGIMRIEKGHPAGPELDGRTTAADLGMARMMSGAKDYVGRTLAGRPAFNEPDRPQLVGFKPVDKQNKMVTGSHILPLGEQAIAATDQGWVSSSSYSPILECWIGLGFVKGGRDRHGEIARALDMLHDKDIEVEIVSPVFYDPEGAKLHG